MNALENGRQASLRATLRSRSLRGGVAIVGSAGAALTLLACSVTAQAAAKPDAAASRAAFLQFYRVLTSPRCQNCHPAGDAPLQGDNSHVHLQNVKRGADGHGVTAMRCDTCHQAANLQGGAHAARQSEMVSAVTGTQDGVCRTLARRVVPAD